MLLFESALSQQYFQQEVNHKIDVRLDVDKKCLYGNIETEYINNSRDTLYSIYYHLWPNAYKNNDTKFAKGQLKLRQTDFYYALTEEKGYIDSLCFVVDGLIAKTECTVFGIDVILLVLPEPLYPNDTTTITTNFYVKIPKVFSRMGYEDNTYCLTQWYPKPAVFDKYGWHPMNYMDMGEFYSEFGSFEVNITVPDDYIVAATGNLLTKKELERLEDYAEICNSNQDINTLPLFGNPTKEKTITFYEKNIHDFAWFASKDFAVDRDYIKLPDSDKTVICWTFYNKLNKELWKNAINYVKQSVSFYSEEIGDYPYKNCIAVEGPLSAGGGMEYPTITVVSSSSSSSLENVIIHEVAHNWFYGMLASNERKEPWIDEGFTSFYESKYYDKYYPKQGLLEQNLSIKSNIYKLNELPARYFRELGWMYLIKENIAQASDLSSEEMSMFNYYIMSYLKPVSVLYMIEKYLGYDSFKDVVKNFYRKYRFQHVYSESIIDFFVSETNDSTLNIYFNELLIGNTIPDYKISGRKNDSIIIKNKHYATTPLFLYIDDSLVIDKGFKGTKKFFLAEKKKVTIDKEFYCPDLNRNNNYYNSGFMTPNKPFKLSLGGIMDNPLVNEFPILPIFAYNTADGFMPGIMFYTTPFPKKKFEYQIIPMYGIKSNNLAGIGNLSFYIHPTKSPIREYELFTKAARFGIDNESHKTRIKFEYGVKIKLRTDPKEFYESTVIVRQIYATDFYSGVIKNYYQVKSCFNDYRKINPWSFVLNVETGNGFAKTSAEIISTITYNQKMKGLSIRFFAGKFLYNTPEYYGNYNFRLAGNLGSQDYFYDNLFIGRSEDVRINPESFWAHQFIRNDGGFTLYTPFGQTNNWLTALNINTSTPIKILDLYFNTGICPSISSDKFVDLFYETGIKLNILNDFICVYFPLNCSPAIWEASNNIYTNNYFQKIRFTLSLDKINLLTYREKPYLLF